MDLHLETDPIWGVPLRNLTESDIREFHARLRLKPGRSAPTLSSRSLRHVHALVRQILSFAVDQGEIDTNPALKVALPRVRDDPSKIKSWTVDETGRFLDLAKTSTAPNSRLWWAFFGFLVCTGLRRGEGAGLRWVDVDFESGTITIRQTRLNAGIETSPPKTTASSRTLAVGSHALGFLHELKAIQEADRALLGAAWTDSGFVLTLPDGLPPSPDAITRRFRRDCERFGLTYITVHGLRHTFATLTLQSGVSIHVVSRILGHSSIAVTLAIYSHVMPGDTRSAMETVGEFMFGGRSATQN
jgi:integrase